MNIVNFSGKEIAGITDLKCDKKHTLKGITLRNYFKDERTVRENFSFFSTTIFDMFKTEDLKDKYFIFGFEKFTDTSFFPEVLTNKNLSKIFIMLTRSSSCNFLYNEKLKSFLENNNVNFYLEDRNDAFFVKSLSEKVNLNGVFLNHNSISSFSEIEISWLNMNFNKLYTLTDRDLSFDGEVIKAENLTISNLEIN